MGLAVAIRVVAPVPRCFGSARSTTVTSSPFVLCLADLSTSVQADFNAACLAIQLVSQVVMKMQGLRD
jgi:amino acid permease